MLSPNDVIPSSMSWFAGSKYQFMSKINTNLEHVSIWLYNWDCTLDNNDLPKTALLWPNAQCLTVNLHLVWCDEQHCWHPSQKLFRKKNKQPTGPQWYTVSKPIHIHAIMLINFFRPTWFWWQICVSNQNIHIVFRNLYKLNNHTGSDIMILIGATVTPLILAKPFQVIKLLITQM